MDMSETVSFRMIDSRRSQLLICYRVSGNLHINICADKYDPEIEKVIEPYVYEIVAEQKGSISAEHGLGRCPADDVCFHHSHLLTMCLFNQV
jgi:hypothetical protein